MEFEFKVFVLKAATRFMGNEKWSSSVNADTEFFGTKKLAKLALEGELEDHPKAKIVEMSIQATEIEEEVVV